MPPESKHTPGPWIAKDLGEGPRGKSLGICIFANRLPMYHLPRGTPQAEANARLIASAPELLEALKDMVSIDSNHDSMDDTLRREKAAKAAIAKAEGPDAA